MQWSPDRNGGVLARRSAMLYLPPIMDLGVRVRGGQCRGAEPLAVLTIELDQGLIAARRSRRAFDAAA
jgi:hypothetical protein